MATVKEYAYYWEGNRIAIVEKDTAFDNDVNSKDFGPGSDRAQWKSPKSSVADGIEVLYTYAPTYFIESTDLSTTTVASWDQDNNGNFRIHASGGTDWTSSPNLSSVTYIVLENAGRFNGLHKVSSVDATRVYTTTRVSASTVNTNFEETVTLYYDVQALVDESFNVPLQPYLNKALVYYVKAKYLEDMGDLEKREYFMSKFYKQIEKYNNAKVTGIRIIASGPLAIR